MVDNGKIDFMSGSFPCVERICKHGTSFSNVECLTFTTIDVVGFSMIFSVGCTFLEIAKMTGKGLGALSSIPGRHS